MKKKPHHSQPNWGYYREGKLYRVYGWGTIYDNIASTQPQAMSRYVFTVATMLLPADAIELVRALGALHKQHNSPRMGWCPLNRGCIDYDAPPPVAKEPVIVLPVSNDSKLMDKVLDNIKQMKIEKPLDPIEDDPFEIMPTNQWDIFLKVKTWINKHFFNHDASDDLISHLKDVALSNDYDTTVEVAYAAVDYLLDYWFDSGEAFRLGYDYEDVDLPEPHDEDMIPDWNGANDAGHFDLSTLIN